MDPSDGAPSGAPVGAATGTLAGASGSANGASRPRRMKPAPAKDTVRAASTVRRHYQRPARPRDDRHHALPVDPIGQAPAAPGL